jgi:hypothetical protein
MESATIGEGDPQLVSTAKIGSRRSAFMAEDVGGQLLAVRVDAPRQPERESSKGCRGGAKCGGDGGE